MKKLALALILAVGLGACEDKSITGDGPLSDCLQSSCSTRHVPFTDSADAPSVTDVHLECQSTSVVVLATATDPQGTDNLRNVQQTVRVFTTPDCEAGVITLRDDFVGSGVEESFGDAVLAASNQALYDQICACSFWPVELQLIDLNGNTTVGTVAALVTR